MGDFNLYLIVLTTGFIGCIIGVYCVMRKQNGKKKLLKWVLSLISSILFLLMCSLLGLAFQEWDQKEQTARIQMDVLGERLDRFKLNCGRYPSTSEGLQFLVKEITLSVCETYPAGGFLEGGVVPVDPWDKNYNYESDGIDYRISARFSDGEVVKVAHRKAVVVK